MIHTRRYIAAEPMYRRSPPIFASWVGDFPFGTQSFLQIGMGPGASTLTFRCSMDSSSPQETSLRAQATSERLRDLRDRLARDLRTACLSAKSTYSPLAVTQQLLEQANLALRLAQSRYSLGLASIVELR